MADKRRRNLIIPYQVPVAAETPSDISATLCSTLPMAAMFTRNKFVGWGSVIFAIQNWLGEGADLNKSSGHPAIFTVGMSFIALMMTYLPLFIPPPSADGKGTTNDIQAKIPAP